jgi:hypothetical protein
MLKPSNKRIIQVYLEVCLCTSLSLLDAAAKARAIGDYCNNAGVALLNTAAL